MQLRIYTYKITFEEIPHWYWGVHKEKKHNDGYMGSPVTHKWMWKFYTPKIQILEFFPYTDEGWREAQEVEKRIIQSDLNNPLCLNEGCGIMISLEVSRKVGRDNVALSRGLYSNEYQGSDRHKEVGRKSGTETGSKNVELKRGVFSDEYQSSERHKEVGRTSGTQAYVNGTGIHSEDWKNSEEYKKNKSDAGLKGGEVTSKQVWVSLYDGYEGTAANVARHNKSRGADPNSRVRVR
jgi:hypothetical protein